MATANPTDTSGIVDDVFLSWPLSAQRAELDRLQHILDRTRECLNLDDDSSFEDRDQWDQATPEPFSASTPIISGVGQDDGNEMPNLTPITPCSVGLFTGQGNYAYGHGAHSVRFSVEPHAEHGCDGIAQGLPPVTGVSTSVTQTSSVFAYSRPLPSPTVHSRSQRRVSFAPVSRDTTTGSMDMEATSVYGGIWLPFGVPSQEGHYAPVSTHGTAKFPCSYQTTPQAREVPQQSMSGVNLQEGFQGPLQRGDAFFYGSDAGVHFPPQSNAGDQLGWYQGHYRPGLRVGSHDVDFQRQACAGGFPPGDGMASHLTHNSNVDVRAMPTRHPYDDVAATGGRGGLSDGVGRGFHGERRMRSNENIIGHGRGDVFFPVPDTGVAHSRHWLHDGRLRNPEGGFPLNLHGNTGVPGSQGMVSDTYHHDDAASRGFRGDLLAGAPWQPGQLIGPGSIPSDVYHDHHAEQPQHDHRLQNDFRLSTTGLNAFGPSGQTLLTSINAGAVGDDIALGRQQDLGFRPGGRGLSPGQQPPNSGCLHAVGQCGTAHGAGEAVFLQGGMHDSHVPRPHSVTPRPDPSSGLSQVSGASMSHHQSASLQRHGWCSIPYEPEPWSHGNVAAQQTVVSSSPSPSPASTAAAYATERCADVPGSRGTGGCPEPAPQPTPASTPAPSGPGVGTDLQGKPKRMPNYDGKSSWSDYLVQFEIAAEMNRWSPKQKAMELATSLVGQARGVLSDLSSSERTDFSALVRKLTLRFEPVDMVGMYQSQLRSRRRKRNESIPELVQEISKLTRKAFPSADEGTRNYMSVTSFITALSNEQQELFVYQRDPKRIEEAGKAAMAFESFQSDRQQHSTQYVRMQKETNQSSTPLGGFTDLAGRIARIEQSQANVQPTRPVTAGNAKRSGKCHYCGIPGHWQRNCFKRKRDAAQASPQSSSDGVEPSVVTSSITSPPVSGNSQ